ncbi:hypothetical protein [Burkholderia thailandensis]|uniref:hypothetical protein n=1 Tax=Burkholderia thailandensis TaxID=57975 RepID=UPI00076BE4B6|nr:hypothetical protein [Burkholderia thailandensis]KVG15929.1 hypothetical protein WJ25_24590 [Burkholderia thailandensis]
MFTYHLFRPFAYLGIAYPNKWRLDWLIPLILSAISTAMFAALALIRPLSIIGDGGLVAKVVMVIQTLPGFYIAALAAIATFNRIDIDRLMPAPSPRLNVLVRGQKVPMDLTRRRFLCVLLAFLTAESLILLISAVFGQTIGPAIRALISERLHFSVLYLGLFVYLLLFWQMMVVTFVGLFYLGDRIHQPDDA